MPALGYMGSAWASFIARILMGLSFLVIVFRSPVTKEIKAVYNQVKVNWQELRDLARIGFNAGLQFTVEVAAFVVAGFMAGTFGKEQIDAHGIALSLAALTYMFGSGIGSAATIRAGIYKAQNNWKEIKHASFIAVKLVLVVMGTCGVLLLLYSNYLPLAFSKEKQIIE
jgi:MATE family multidrug resistance protein